MTISRRRFLQTAAVLSGTMACPGFVRSQGTNEKLVVACIGIMGRGRASVEGVKGEQIAALCDVNEENLEKVGAEFPDAKRFVDWREMLDALDGQIDAVTVGTTDHTHAPIALAAMCKGIHCYCEKPLAHTIQEIRTMARVAAENKIVTQMGTQIHASETYRRAVEVLRAGAIGDVTDVWIWTAPGPNGLVPPTENPPCPEKLHWDLWVGPSDYVDYNPCYCPGMWRYWWNFGSGRFGDMACHLTDLAYWALDLKWPSSVKASSSSENVLPAATPPALDVEYLFKSPREIRLHWRVGTPPAILKENGLPEWSQGILFGGPDGFYLVDYERNLLFPEEKFAGYQRPEPTIAPSIGHHLEWLAAIRANDPNAPLCEFQYGARLSQGVFLGNVSYRAGGASIEWDPVAGKVTNCPEANAFLTKNYRDGWAFL